MIPSGNLLYSQIEIEHRKIGPGDPDRNLKIYESMLENGEILEPRHQFYYGRELFTMQDMRMRLQLFVIF